MKLSTENRLCYTPVAHVIAFYEHVAEFQRVALKKSE